MLNYLYIRVLCFSYSVIAGVKMASISLEIKRGDGLLSLYTFFGKALRFLICPFSCFVAN